MLSIKTKKSAGVKVTAPVHKLISQGNRARNVGEWSRAADAYRAALQLDSGLTHIWIQLGHASSEAGRWDEGAEAYRTAIAKGANRGESLLHLGHLLKRAGDSSGSAYSYLEAARAGNAEALMELNTRVGRLVPIDRSVLERAIQPQAIADGRRSNLPSAITALDAIVQTAPDADVTRILTTVRQALAGSRLDHDQVADDAMLAITYDISDLVAHFRNHRLPTGIQRVQIEVLERALLDRSCVNRICCFVEGNEYLAEIPATTFMELANLARLGTNSQEPQWVEAVARLFVQVAIAPPYEFVQNECLVNLGTSWWIYNYFLFLRNAKDRFNIRFVAVVYDLIPLYATEHCIRGISEDYIGWLVGAFRHTDHFLVISEATGRDLVRAAMQLGYESIADKVSVIPLDADFRSPIGKASPKSALENWNLAGKDFALSVSTIESRKNHALVLDAWAECLRSDDLPNLPQLVFVGRNGWLNDQVFSRLAANPRLRQRVTIIERASDEDLALLYGACLFTVYPSLYEGWGLPVTEALCYGKLPIVANNSSLPEAGGKFALFFESNSVPALTAAIRKVVSDSVWREAQEDHIRTNFAPRPWAAVSDQVITAAKALAVQPATGWTAPRAEAGKYYPIGRYRGVRIWNGLESGEVFRCGDGWHWPDDEGSRTRDGGAELQFSLPSDATSWRLFLRLTGLGGEECPYEIRIGGELAAAGSLRPGECRWARGASFVTNGTTQVVVQVRGLIAERVELLQGGGHKPRVASIGVAGFYIFPSGDEESYERLLEAAALNRLDDVNAYKER
jgi:glycosyltransferase involved in cell wall biosynthesis